MLSFWRFCSCLAIVLLLVFWLHMCFTAATKLFFGYGFNYLITIISFFLLLVTSRKKIEILGFVFMAISGVKFFFFFLLFKPFSTPINEKKELFLSFFVPYALCSIYEVYCLVKFLNEKKEKK